MKLLVEKFGAKLGKKVDYATITSLELPNAGITSVGSFGRCARLEVIDLSGNHMQKLEHIEGLFDAPRLRVLQLTGCPVCKRPDFRSFCLKLCVRLEMLNGEKVQVDEKKEASGDLFGHGDEEKENEESSEEEEDEDIIEVEDDDAPQPQLTITASQTPAPVVEQQKAAAVEEEEEEEESEEEEEVSAAVEQSVPVSPAAVQAMEEESESDSDAEAEAGEAIVDDLEKVKKMYMRGAEDVEVDDDELLEEDSDDLLGDDDDKPAVKSTKPVSVTSVPANAARSAPPQRKAPTRTAKKNDFDLASYIKSEKDQAKGGLFD